MHWRNTQGYWGLVSIVLHWVIALTLIGLFGIGLYMVGLSYTDPLSNTLPHWHRSLGIIVGLALVIRLAWRFVSPPPAPLPNYKRSEHLMAMLMHWILYVLTIVIVVSGYLISTSDGRGFAVFSWFEMPAFAGDLGNTEELAGDIHRWLAWTLVVLASLHALAALKHHFIDRDATLTRMLRTAPKRLTEHTTGQ